MGWKHCDETDEQTDGESQYTPLPPQLRHFSEGEERTSYLLHMHVGGCR